jgi:hypothetical protein
LRRSSPRGYVFVNSKISAPPSVNRTLNAKPSTVLRFCIAASEPLPFCKRALAVHYALVSSIRSVPLSVSAALNLSPSDFVFTGLYPEAKFHNGDYLDRGITHRRHIVATAVEHIGKEANRWEEQFYVGLDHEAQTDYGLAPEDSERVLSTLRVACDQLGQRAVAKSVRMSLRDVSALVQGKRKPTPLMLTKLYRMVPRLE